MLTATLALASRNALPVLRIDGEEALGEGFRYEIDVALARGAALAAADTVGGAALLTLRQGDASTGTTIHLSAVVTACTALGEVALAGGAASALWRLRLEPALARWEHDRANAISADANPVDAIDAALKASGVAYSTACVAAAEHATRQHLVRWQESTAAFATRLCEEEGIHSFYVHQAPGSDTESDAKAPALGRHVLVLAERNHNQASAGSDSAKPRRIPNPQATVAATAPYQRLWSWQGTTSEAADRAEVDDRDADRFGANGDKATEQLAGGADLARTGAGLGAAPAAGLKRIDRLAPAGLGGVADGHDSLSGTVADGVGAAAARRRAEEALCRARRFHGVGDHLGLGAGTLLSFAGAPDERFLVLRRRRRLLPALVVADPAGAAGGEQRLARLARRQVEGWRRAPRTPELAELPELAADTGASWDGASLWVEVAVEAIPAALTFRPPRRRPAPVLAGLHLATVASTDATARAGAVRSDSLGRVRVQFDWAPTAQLSGWMRVAQGVRGLASVPRIGERVAVAFAYGDPGRPLVAGMVHDAASALPGDPNAEDGEVGRLVLGGRFADKEGHYRLDKDDVPTRPTLARAADYAAGNENGTGYLADAAGALAAAARGSYLAFEDQLEKKRGIDLFTAGRMREQVGGDRTIKVGHKLVVEAGGSIEFKVGDFSLKLNRAGATIGHNCKHVPVTSKLKITPYKISVEAPKVDISGTLGASMSSCCAKIKATLSTISMSAVDVKAESGLSNLMGAVDTLLDYGLSEAVDGISPADAETPGSQEVAQWFDLVYFISKEAMIAVKDVSSITSTALSLGMSPLDVMGEGVSESVLGASYIHAKAFDAKGAEKTIDQAAKFAKKSGEKSAKKLAKKAAREFGSMLVGQKWLYTDHVTKDDRADRRAWAGRLIDYGIHGYEWYEELKGIAKVAKTDVLDNRVGVNGVSGVKIYGTTKDSVLLEEKSASLKNSDSTVKKDDLAVKKDDTSVQKSDTGLQKSDTSAQTSNTSAQTSDTNVSKNGTGVLGTGTNVTSADTGVAKTDTGVSNKNVGVLVTNGPF
ncbi:MAG: phage baseplate assembly protein V [Planctomycetes bacterium]|nr:phage baseplate assembly protein V [Planctomycetota bacterium]